MNYPAAPSNGIRASLRQATGYQPEYFLSPQGGSSPPVRRRIEKESQPFKNGWLYTAFKNKSPSRYATGPPPPIILFESSV
jgi:hypothetical protein